MAGLQRALVNVDDRDPRERLAAAAVLAARLKIQPDGGKDHRQLVAALNLWADAKLVDAAARAGERGERVRTWLGRTSPPGRRDAPAQQARAWGRFTRNFIVQGTAAEWALCWLGGIRGRLSAAFPGPFPDGVPHLVFFLHDEVIVHTPAEHAEVVAELVRAAAADAGRLLFGDRPARFPLSVAIVEDYAAAKGG